MTDDVRGSGGCQSVVSRFCDHVEQSPQQVAIRTPDGSVSRRELDLLSNRVAHTVSSSDERRPVLVACEDELDYLVAKLGVLKAGRPVVPLHPGEPPSRMTMIVEQSRADTVILSSGQSLSAALGDVRVVRMDLLVTDESAPVGETAPDDVALLTFTSGSTGVPKAVVHSQRTVALRSDAYGRALGMTAADRVILLSRESDLDFVAALILGATAYPFDIRMRGIADLPRWVRDQRISLLRSPPSVLRAFVARSAAHRFPDLRLVASAGEVLSPHDLEGFRSVFDPQTTLLQVYGSAEAGVVTTLRIDDSFDTTTDILPVGSPVPGVGVTLRDSEGLVPGPGESGVIVVTSPCLAAGYLSRDDLTAARFTGVGDDRQFVTGDLGRIDDRGRLVFLGRDDDLVKVRGHRIEIGEVEAALRRVPGIVEAVVVPRSDADGATTLVGYYTEVGSEPLQVSDIRAGMAQHLPDFMIPTAWVPMDVFPIAGIAKIDRTALPPPPSPADTPPISGDDVASRMARLWRDLLGVGEVAMSDSFFDLGGDSLAAAALMAAVEEEFGCRVPMADLFENETFEFMCTVVESADSAASHDLLVPLKRSGDLEPLYCVYLPGWPEALYWSLSRHVDQRRPVTAVLEDLRIEDPPEDTLTEIATRYARSIRQDSDGPYHLLGSSAGGILAYEIGRVLAEQGADVGFVGVIDSGYPGVRRSIRTRLRLQLRRLKTGVWRYGARGAVSLAISRAVGPEAELQKVRTRLLQTYGRYRITPFAGPVTYFRATDDKGVSASLAGWQALGVTVVDVEGSHTGPESTLNKRNAPGLAHALESAIAASSAKSPGSDSAGL